MEKLFAFLNWPIVFVPSGARTPERVVCSEHQVELSRHLAKLWKRTRIHFTHRPAAVDLYGSLGNADFVGNPLARPSPRDLNHNLKLSGAQGCETSPEVGQRAV